MNKGILTTRRNLLYLRPHPVKKEEEKKNTKNIAVVYFVRIQNCCSYNLGNSPVNTTDAY